MSASPTRAVSRWYGVSDRTKWRMPSSAYLRNAASDSGAVVDYRDWQVPLGRRFRALIFLSSPVSL